MQLGLVVKGITVLTFVSLFQSMGKSLTFEQSVFEAIDIQRRHKCKDPICEMNLWKAKHQLDMALLKIKQLRADVE